MFRARRQTSWDSDERSGNTEVRAAVLTFYHVGERSQALQYYKSLFGKPSNDSQHDNKNLMTDKLKIIHNTRKRKLQEQEEIIKIKSRQKTLQST